jgi:CBS domain containing-hemolysin-like protein
MTWIIPVALVILLALLTLSSYVLRVYTEMGKFLSREFQDNIDTFEEQVEPRLGSLAGRAALSFSVLSQLSIATIALLIAYPKFRAGVSLADLLEIAASIILAVIVFHHILPFLFFSRTKGLWLVPFTPLLKALILLTMPLTVVLGFVLSVAKLSKERSAPEPESQQEAVDALIEAGTEEGILEERDRDLIHSVVEFGDKTVHDAMTPRPRVFAVPMTTSIEQFIDLLREKKYSRVPVYEEALDNIKGIVFAHDVLQVADTEARKTTVAQVMREDVMFVPESKRGTDLLREMQKENTHMAVVIDEYGGVAGVVTIEDLVEEIVGEIHDEHEAEGEIMKESETSYVVSGNVDVDLLDDLFGVRFEDHEATTVAGLVSELMGRIPRPGEHVDSNGLRFEVLNSTDRRIERLRICTAQPEHTNEPADRVTPGAKSPQEQSKS